MKLSEVKQNEKNTLLCSLSFEAKKLEAKRSEKIFFCFQKQIAFETDLVSLCFALKQNSFEAKPAHSSLCEKLYSKNTEHFKRLLCR